MSVVNLLNNPTKSKTVVELSLDDLRTVVCDVLKKEQLRAAEEAKQNETLEILTRHEVCKLLNVSRSTLYKWDKSGYLKPIRFGVKLCYVKKEVLNLISK